MPANRVFENENVLAFSPLEGQTITRGHMLVIPKQHYVDIYDIPREELSNVMEAVKLIAEKLKKNYNADGINFLNASGKVAQQSSFHFHVHLIPRYKNDGLDTWPKTGYKEINFLEEYKKIREALK